MDAYVKVAACTVLIALVAVSFAESCNCSAPDQECTAGGDTPCCGCGTLQSQCTTCADDYYCSYGSTSGCQGGTSGYAFCTLKT
jgi:hypothetical protein